MKKQCVIYDFETLGTNPRESVALCMAALVFDESRFTSENPYQYEELLYSAKLIKFSVEDQIQKYVRTISKDTLKWWSEQPAETKKYLLKDDTDVPLVELHPFVMDLTDDPKNVAKVYTRGNTFDPLFLESLLNDIQQKDPFPWWKLRDTRSMIEGMTFGSDISNSFIPEGLEKQFTAHDPIHDISMDVMRLQYLARLLCL